MPIPNNKLSLSDFNDKEADFHILPGFQRFSQKLEI
jgi:hypothetical protein